MFNTNFATVNAILGPLAGARVVSLDEQAIRDYSEYCGLHDSRDSQDSEEFWASGDAAEVNFDRSLSLLLESIGEESAHAVARRLDLADLPFNAKRAHAVAISFEVAKHLFFASGESLFSGAAERAHIPAESSLFVGIARGLGAA